jgi:hypothetical protein
MKLGGSDIVNVQLGNTQVNKVYQGANLVWEYAFDADYQAILDYATTQGYTLPSAGQQSKQNLLLVSLKNAGIWSKLDTFGVFATDAEDSPGSETSNFALIDWIRLSQYTAVNSPTFNVNEGFQGNGTSSYIDLNYTTTTDWVNASQNNTSAFAYAYRNPAPLNTVILGSLNTAGILMPITNNAFRIYNNPNVAFSNSVGVGLFTANRNSSTSLDAYINGNLLGVNNSTNSLSITTPVYACRFGTTYTPASPSIIGIAAYIDAIENDDFNNAVNTYMTSI